MRLCVPPAKRLERACTMTFGVPQGGLLAPTDARCGVRLLFVVLLDVALRLAPSLSALRFGLLFVGGSQLGEFFHQAFVLSLDEGSLLSRRLVEALRGSEGEEDGGFQVSVLGLRAVQGGRSWASSVPPLPREDSLTDRPYRHLWVPHGPIGPLCHRH